MALDPVAFAVERLGFTPDDWQAAVLRDQGKRLLLNCHRQSGKSTTIAIKALHWAIYQRDSLILLVSPSFRQSGELFRKVVDFFWRLENAPALLEDNKLSLTMENKSRIVSLPGHEETIRGFSGAKLIIEDEASRVPDELYVAVRPMLAASDGDLVLMSTPFGKRGHFYEEWMNGGPEWERVEVKVTQSPRISKVFLTGEKRALGEHFYAQEYMCEFRDTIDQLFSSELIEKALANIKRGDW